MASSAGGGEALAAYIESYLAAAHEGAAQVPALFPLAWHVARWALLALALSFTALGLIGIPALFAARGFLLSFAICSFVLVLGPAGYVVAFLLVGLGGLLEIPALFMIGTRGMLAGRRLAGRPTGAQGRRAAVLGREALLWYGICAAALAACVLVQMMVAPALLSLVMGGLAF